MQTPVLINKTDKEISFQIGQETHSIPFENQAINAFFQQQGCETVQIADKIFNIDGNIANFTVFVNQHYFPILNSDFFKKHIATTINNLGPRFSEELNFQLPIAQIFHYLAKDNMFKTRFIAAFDTYLSQTKEHNNSTILKDIDVYLKETRKQIIDFVNNIDWNIETKIEVSHIQNMLNELYERCQNKRIELYTYQTEERKKKNDYLYKEVYPNEIYFLNEYLESINKLQNSIEKQPVHLSNEPILFIKGEAGTGKSHLLGDIAQKRIKDDLPTIFLLGTDFKQGDSAWERIIKHLGISCTKMQLLESLNKLGKTKNSRVLIFLDALNEGAGKSLWHNELAGFIHEVLQYPYIGLVCTIRSTYLKNVIPEHIREAYPIIEHKGFLGNEYAALSMFCKYYGLQTPIIPLLSPEFTNPLFLKLTCKALSDSPHKVFPKGGQGIISIFENYLAKVIADLQKLREEYENRPQLLRTALEAFTSLTDTNYMRVELETAHQFFDEKYSKFPNLLNDLINHSLLIRNTGYDYDTSQYKDYLMFAYQRLGDFMKAQALIQSYTNALELKNACWIDAPLGTEFLRLCDEGVLGLISILLPEKYGIELFEMYDYIYEDNDINEWHRQHICNAILSNLLWRKTESIDNDKLTKWINNEDIHDYTYFNIIISLTAIPNHPFNSDRLYRILNSYDMPERDTFWQQYLWYYLGKDDRENPYPLQRLIDWAWTPQISAKADSETIRLVSQTLTWVLASTYPEHRDSVTKALVNLLQEQPNVLIQTLQHFENVEDMYIQERLYAIAYGCILRTTNKDAIIQIATYTYNAIFAQGNPPVHVLLRCYARNIVEYAIYRNCIDIDKKIITPPYNSLMPHPMPKAEDINKYDIPMNDKDDIMTQNHKRVQNYISHSVKWEYYKDRINYILRNVSTINEKDKEEYQSFFKQFTKSKRELLRFYQEYKEREYQYFNQQSEYYDNSKKESIKKILALVKEGLTQVTSKIQNTFSEEQQSLIFGKYTDYLDTVYKEKYQHYSNTGLAQKLVRAWIVQRVFELGFNVDLHYDFDSNIIDGYAREVPDRIGKKYENIAYYEILARIFDNYKIKESYSSSSKYHFFQGTWQYSLRDIDPTSITKELSYDYDETQKIEVLNQLKQQWWYCFPDYNFDQKSEIEWVKNLADLPSIPNILEIKDEQENSWLYLETHLNWDEPKRIGEDKHKQMRNRKDLWYQIRSYLIPKNQKNAIIKYLEKKKVYRGLLPEGDRSFPSIYSRENYWSLASKFENTEVDNWTYLENEKRNKTNLKLKVTINNATDEFSEDKSNTKKQYLMPCKAIFEGLDLQYGSEDTCFYNSDGEIIAFSTELNPYSYIGCRGLLIRKDKLTAFLESNNLDIIWAVIGEKMLVRESDVFARNNLSGVYYLDDNTEQVAGNITDDIEMKTN